MTLAVTHLAQQIDIVGKSMLCRKVYRRPDPASFVILGGWLEVAARGHFSVAGQPAGRLSRGSAVSTCPRMSFLVAGTVPAGQPGARGLEADDRGGDLSGPGPADGEAEPQAAAAAEARTAPWLRGTGPDH